MSRRNSRRDRAPVSSKYAASMSERVGKLQSSDGVYRGWALSGRYQDCKANPKVPASVSPFIRDEICIERATPNFEITPCNLEYNFHEIKNFFPPPTLSSTRVTRVAFFSGEHELRVLVLNLRDHINHTGETLVRQLRRKDHLTTKCEKLCAIITAHLQAVSQKRGEYTRRIFTILLSVLSDINASHVTILINTLRWNMTIRIIEWYCKMKIHLFALPTFIVT